jgi:hypothetical protein
VVSAIGSPDFFENRLLSLSINDMVQAFRET